MRHLYTIGYEGSSVGAFVACLRDAGITRLVDVRELPLSRKPGFSKAALAEHLRASDIAYEHARSLGCPRDIRVRYKREGSWAHYSRDFLAYLDTQPEAIEALARRATGDACCIMCFEADFTRCHRTYVARAAAARGAPSIVHLRVEAEPIADAEVRKET